MHGSYMRAHRCLFCFPSTFKSKSSAVFSSDTSISSSTLTHESSVLNNFAASLLVDQCDLEVQSTLVLCSTRSWSSFSSTNARCRKVRPQNFSSPCCTLWTNICSTSALPSLGQTTVATASQRREKWHRRLSEERRPLGEFYPVDRAAIDKVWNEWFAL